MATPKATAKKRVVKKKTAAVAGLPASVKAETVKAVQPAVQAGKSVRIEDLVEWVNKPYFRVENGVTIKLDAEGKKAKRQATDAVGAMRKMWEAKKAGVDPKPATLKLLHDVAADRKWTNITHKGVQVYSFKVQA